jgi:hypothetical protein
MVCGCAGDGASDRDTLQSVDRQGAAGDGEQVASSASQPGQASSGQASPNQASPNQANPAQPSDESACLGKLTPPRGAGGAGYRQETAYSTTDSLEQVERNARAKLRDKLCQGILCSMIEQNISIWETKQSGGYRCVMAVIKVDHVAEWKARVEIDLGDQLTDRARSVIERLRMKLDGDTPRVTIAKIADHGVPGGPRSEWLYRNLQYALEQASAEVVPLKSDWSGQGLPGKVDGVVHTRIISLGGTEATLEVLWKIKTLDQVFTAEAARFPEMIAPKINDATYLPPLNVGSDKIAIHFDAREGGGLCHGQETELWLETTEDMHVRVINLYGKSGGIVIFPIQEGDDDVIKAGQPVSLGKFEAMQVGEIGVERFLVIASPKRKDLGKFASADHFCRMPFSMAGQFQRGENLPRGKDLHMTETGFRLMSGEDCAGIEVSDAKVAATKQALNSVGACW